MIYLQLFYTFLRSGSLDLRRLCDALHDSRGSSNPLWLGELAGVHGYCCNQPNDTGTYRDNAATYVGFTSTGSVVGSVIATFAVVLPSFILMLTISKFFLKYQKHPVVESIFSGLRPAVVGLLASAALVLMNVENFGSPTTDHLLIRYQYYHLSSRFHRNQKI